MAEEITLPPISISGLLNQNIKEVKPDGTIRLFDDSDILKAIAEERLKALKGERKIEPSQLMELAPPVQEPKGLKKGEANALDKLRFGLSEFLNKPENLLLLGELGRGLAPRSPLVPVSKFVSQSIQNQIAQQLQDSLLGKGPAPSKEAIAALPAEARLTALKTAEALKQAEFERKQAEKELGIKEEGLGLEERAQRVAEEELGIRRKESEADIALRGAQTRKIIELRTDENGVPDPYGEFIGEFAYNPKTGKYDQFQGMAGETDSSGRRVPPSRNSALISKAEQAAIAQLMDEVREGIKRKLGGDVAKLNQVLESMRDQFTGTVVIPRAFEFLTDEQKKEYARIVERILSGLDEGKSFGELVRDEVERRAAVLPGTPTKAKKTNPNF